MSTTSALARPSSWFRRLGFGVIAGLALSVSLLGLKPAHAGGGHHGHHGHHGHSGVQFFFGFPLFSPPAYYYGGYPRAHVYRESYYPHYGYYPRARWHYDHDHDSDSDSDHGYRRYHRHGHGCRH
jgi:hypothetical protein